MNDLNPIDAGQNEGYQSSVPDGSTDQATPQATPAASPTPSVADQLYEVKIGGQVRKVPLNELLSGYSRTQDYTQKTMALAEERRRIEAGIEQERQQVREFLSKRENVQQLLDYLATQDGGQNPQNPQNGQPLTAQQLQAALAAERARQAQDRQALMQELEMKQTESSYRADIDTHIKGILETHPELKSIRGVDRILKQAALEQDPATVEEAKQYILQAAADQVEAIKAHFVTQQKAAAVAKANLTQRGTEPPGGAAPMPLSKPVGKLGSPDFNADVSAYFQQVLQNSK